MYIMPTEYKCKCGFEMKYSPSHHYTFLPISKEGNPFCYPCLIKLISQNVPEMKRVKED